MPALRAAGHAIAVTAVTAGGAGNCDKLGAAMMQRDIFDRRIVDGALIMQTVMDELTATVRVAADMSPEQATLAVAVAVAAMLRCLAARLPSALLGELYARLALPRPDPAPQGNPP